LRRSASGVCPPSVFFDDASLQLLGDQTQQSSVIHALPEHGNQSFVGYFIEKPADVRVQHPVHLPLLQNRL
jgi:hypothetical protein